MHRQMESLIMDQMESLIMDEHTCQCCGRIEALPVGVRDSPTWGGAWSFPPIHELTTCPRCPSSHLITGAPCDHEWTEDRYEAAHRNMEQRFPWLPDVIAQAHAKGWTVEQLKGEMERRILSREKKQ